VSEALDFVLKCWSASGCCDLAELCPCDTSHAGRSKCFFYSAKDGMPCQTSPLFTQTHLS